LHNNNESSITPYDIKKIKIEHGKITVHCASKSPCVDLNSLLENVIANCTYVNYKLLERPLLRV